MHYSWACFVLITQVILDQARSKVQQSRSTSSLHQRAWHTVRLDSVCWVVELVAITQLVKLITLTCY
jgi:hypothetical protein